MFVIKVKIKTVTYVNLIQYQPQLIAGTDETLADKKNQSTDGS